MGAITGYLTKATEFAGYKKLVTLTALVASASDTITLTEATHGISSIDAVIGCVIKSGLDDAFTAVQASASGLVITVVSKEQDGSDSTAWGDTVVQLTVLGTI